MFSHSVFLKIGEISNMNFDSLSDRRYELVNFEYTFQQGIDCSGKVSTVVSGGTMFLTLPSLPSKELVDWSLNSRKYKNGMIAVLGQDIITKKKIFFRNTACINMTITYSSKGKSGVVTNLILQAEELTVGDNVYFLNNWV